MGKPMGKRNNNNYFSQNIQQRGEEFIETKDSRQLQSDAIRIFRDLARGNVDIDKYGEYLLNPMMLNACIQASATKLMYYSSLYKGMTFYMNAAMANQAPPATQDDVIILDDTRMSMEVYQIIYTSMQNIFATQDLSYLPAMISGISRFRNNI